MIIDGIIVAVALLLIAALFAGTFKGMDAFDLESFLGMFAGISVMLFGFTLILAVGIGSLALIDYRHDIKHAERIEIIDGR